MVVLYLQIHCSMQVLQTTPTIVCSWNYHLSHTSRRIHFKIKRKHQLKDKEGIQFLRNFMSSHSSYMASRPCKTIPFTCAFFLAFFFPNKNYQLDDWAADLRYPFSPSPPAISVITGIFEVNYKQFGCDTVVRCSLVKVEHVDPCFADNVNRAHWTN